MIRSALILCAAAIVATCVACAVGTAPAPSITPAAAADTCKAVLLSKLRFLSSPFQPDTGLTAPDGMALPEPYASDLGAAFDAASPQFQARLCSLDRIYVQNTSCTSPEECLGESWGWWQSTNKLGGGRLVGLSLAFWQKYKTGPSPVANTGAYSAYESDLTQTVLPLSPQGVQYSEAQTCAAPGGCNCDGGGTCTGIDNFAMALLGALAHEVGHIRWYDLVVTPLGAGKYSKPRNICTGGANFLAGWAKVTGPPKWRSVLTPQERQREWGGPHSNWPSMHAMGPHIRDIDWKMGNPQQLTAELYGASEPWASAFGAVSPDEDFVETYKFKVLTTANTPLKWAKITVPTQSPANVADDYARGAKSVLWTKVGCIPASF